MAIEEEVDCQRSHARARTVRAERRASSAFLQRAALSESAMLIVAGRCDPGPGRMEPRAESASEPLNWPSALRWDSCSSNETVARRQRWAVEMERSGGVAKSQTAGQMQGPSRAAQQQRRGADTGIGCGRPRSTVRADAQAQRAGLGAESGVWPADVQRRVM